MLNDLISGIRFLQTGEAYIINAEGTDIAVSDLSHISWVTSQYNAREIIEAVDGKVDAETLSIFQAEKMGVWLRQLVEEAAMPNHADGVVTISVGICHIAHATDNNFSHSLSIADRHLYLAKERGRNQVVIDS